MSHRNPASAELGLPYSKYRGGPELIAVDGSTELKATVKPYPTADGTPARVRLMIQSVDQPIWVGYATPITAAKGWKLLPNVPMQFSGDRPIYAIKDGAAASVNVLELGPETEETS